jgi:hypothetical protein
MVLVSSCGYVYWLCYQVFCVDVFFSSFFPSFFGSAQCKWLWRGWQWPGGSDFGMDGERRLRRFEWCENHSVAMCIGTAVMC